MTSEEMRSGRPLQLEFHEADDPRVVAAQVSEEYTNHVVPPSARLSRSTVFFGWSSVASGMAFLYYGAVAAVLAGVTQAIIGLVLMVLVSGAIGAFATREAVRTGLNSTLLSREIFGAKGAALGPLLCASAGVFYAVFESSALAAALQTYVGGGDIRMWYAVVMVAQLPLMLGGLQTWMAKLNGISLPFYFFGILAAVFAAGLRFGWDGDWSSFEASPSALGIPGWLTVFVLYMGIWILFPDGQDAARMGKAEDSGFHQAVTFGWVYYALAYLVNGAVGIAIVGLTAGQPGVSPTELGSIQGIVAALGIAGLLVVVISQVRINTGNFYFASIMLERFVGHFSSVNLSRRLWVTLLCVLVFALMFTDVFSYITTALAWQGVLVTAWVGMMLVSWVARSARDIEFRPGRLRAVAPGFVLWVVIAGIGILLIERPTAFPTLSALAPLVCFGLAVIGYTIVTLLGWSAMKPVDGDPIRAAVENVWDARVRCQGCDLHYVAVEMDVRARDGHVRCLACQATN